MRAVFDQVGSYGAPTTHSDEIVLNHVRPVSLIVSDLERVAIDIEYWCRGSRDELAVALDEALRSVHRTIVAVQEAQASEMQSVPEHWLG